LQFETLFGDVVLCSGDGVAEETRALMRGQRVNAGLELAHLRAYWSVDLMRTIHEAVA
jgi:hypothetical protein